MIENRPAGVAPTHKQTESEYWAEQFARANGGTARRKVRRAYKRAQDKKVVLANRRRVRQHWAQNSTATTLANQLRIYDGQFGTASQRDRITAWLLAEAKTRNVTLDELEADLRAAVELPALVVA